MKNFESVFIAKSTITDEELEAIIEKIKIIITADKGTIQKVEKIGVKKLAYEIKKNKEGLYVVIEFTTEPEKIAELERFYRLNEMLIKFITIEKEDESK